MKKPIQGTLNFYFATGESSRPQFIGDNSQDVAGRVVNYSEVYDISYGDKIRFLHPSLVSDAFISVDEDTHSFLYHLSLLWNTSFEDLKIEYLPSSWNKGWQEHSESIKKDQI